jgi:predicted acylesterase/phospholipase RssA
VEDDLNRVMNRPVSFKSIVFAGGGSRCLWQAGFWEVAAPALNLAPAVVAGTSAGATIACIMLCGRHNFALNYMKNATRDNRSNFYPRNIFRGQRVCPHVDIYRAAILATVTPEALQRLWNGPELRVLMSRPPRRAGPRTGLLLGFMCYMVEKWISNPVHSTLAVKCGFRPVVFRANDCRSPEMLADLLIASSATPPMTPVMQWNGFPVLDGGLVDNAPVQTVGALPEPTLVLLTRFYPAERIPRVQGRIYVQPSRPVPVKKWDYTSPEGLQAAFDLGRRDGERFAELRLSQTIG